MNDQRGNGDLNDADSARSPAMSTTTRLRVTAVGMVIAAAISTWVFGLNVGPKAGSPPSAQTSQAAETKSPAKPASPTVVPATPPPMSPVPMK